MAEQTPEHVRAQKIRIFGIGAVVWLVAAVAFALVAGATGLNGFTGVTLSLTMFVVSIGVVLWLKRQQRRADR